MILKVFWYGVQDDGHLTEKYCWGASFFVGACMHQVYTRLQNFKFFKPCKICLFW